MRARRFLVVGDEVASAISLTLGSLGPMTRVNRVDTASRALVEDGRSWTGLFLDRTLPDGSAFAVLDRARALGLEIPALVFMQCNGYDEVRTDTNRGQELGAPCLPMPVSCPNVLLSVRRADAAALADEAEDELSIQRYVKETGQPIEVVKGLVMDILEKTGGRTLAEAIRRLRRGAAAPQAPRRRKKKISQAWH